tara:strand:+ start:292 stop:534 length:243 start_codon:yes stop_codon:yes gene_type:complete
MKNERIINKRLKNLIDEKKIEFFNEPQKITDEEVLGILISQFFKWDGNKIFKTTYSAFEDSNFHQFNEDFEKIWNKEFNR